MVRHKASRTPLEADPSAFFEIEADGARHLLQLRLRGVWDHAVFDAFAANYLRVMREMRHSGGVSYALIDATNFAFQSGEITERFPQLLLACSDRARRTAIVVSALVNKVQAKRAGELRDARYFRSVADATDWLFGDEA